MAPNGSRSPGWMGVDHQGRNALDCAVNGSIWLHNSFVVLILYFPNTLAKSSGLKALLDKNGILGHWVWEEETVPETGITCTGIPRAPRQWSILYINMVVNISLMHSAVIGTQLQTDWDHIDLKRASYVFSLAPSQEEFQWLHNNGWNMSCWLAQIGHDLRWRVATLRLPDRSGSTGILWSIQWQFWLVRMILVRRLELYWIYQQSPLVTFVLNGTTLSSTCLAMYLPWIKAMLTVEWNGCLRRFSTQHWWLASQVMMGGF